MFHALEKGTFMKPYLSTNVSRDQEQHNMYITCMYTTQDTDVYVKVTNLFVNFYCIGFKDQASAT